MNSTEGQRGDRKHAENNRADAVTVDASLLRNSDKASSVESEGTGADSITGLLRSSEGGRGASDFRLRGSSGTASVFGKFLRPFFLSRRRKRSSFANDVEPFVGPKRLRFAGVAGMPFAGTTLLLALLFVKQTDPLFLIFLTTAVIILASSVTAYAVSRSAPKPPTTLQRALIDILPSSLLIPSILSMNYRLNTANSSWAFLLNDSILVLVLILNVTVLGLRSQRVVFTMLFQALLLIVVVVRRYHQRSETTDLIYRSALILIGLSISWFIGAYSSLRSVPASRATQRTDSVTGSTTAGTIDSSSTTVSPMSPRRKFRRTSIAQTVIAKIVGCMDSIEYCRTVSTGEPVDLLGSAFNSLEDVIKEITASDDIFAPFPAVEPLPHTELSSSEAVTTQLSWDTKRRHSAIARSNMDLMFEELAKKPSMKVDETWGVPYASTESLGPFAGMPNADQATIRAIGFDMRLNLLSEAVLTTSKPLLTYGWFILLPYMQQLGAPPDKARGLLERIERAYLPNAYHNSIHGLAVAHQAHILIKNLDLDRSWPSWTIIDLMGFLVACFAHDVGHSGRTATHLVATRNPLVALFPTSPLEHMHAAILNGILEHEDADIFCNVTSESRPHLKRWMTNLILATDMSQNAKYMELYEVTRKYADFDYRAVHDHVAKVGIMLIKAADVGHAVLPLKQHTAWSFRCVEEFYQQSEQEELLGMELTTPFCRHVHKSQFPGTQSFFLTTCAMPIWSKIWELNPENIVLQQCRGACEFNIEHWEEILSADENSRDLDPTFNVPEHRFNIPDDVMEIKSRGLSLMQPFLNCQIELLALSQSKRLELDVSLAPFPGTAPSGHRSIFSSQTS